MEQFVLFVCACWFWLTRKRRSTRYEEIAASLHSAWRHLWMDYATRASTRDRGFMLPAQVEALAILEMRTGIALQTSRRLQSLTECYHFVCEELGVTPIRVPVVNAPRLGAAGASSTPPELVPAAATVVPSTGGLRWIDKAPRAA